MDELFKNDKFKPLAERVRPSSLDEFIGQEKVIGIDSPIRKMIENNNISSMILWGPCGVGKTTIAKMISKISNNKFYELSASVNGVKDVKEVLEIAKINKHNEQKSILFIDEIHRFNRLQQDILLPYIENGDIILIGATTENPSFEINNALLSRVKVYVLSSLTNENIKKILENAIRKYYNNFVIDEEVLELIAQSSSGDARNALNSLEDLLKLSSGNVITKEIGIKYFSDTTLIYDKNGEEHYNLISALHKSMRNSDSDAAVYYLSRMLEAGENPLYIARRLIRFASEDVGLADPNALTQAINVYQACHFIGMPECTVNLTQVVIYLSLTAKSNSLYKAYEKAKQDALKTNHLKVPLHLRNAVTKLDKSLHYGEGYKYAHDEINSITDMRCLPPELENRVYYIPSNNGREKNVQVTLNNIKKLKEELKE